MGISALLIGRMKKYLYFILPLAVIIAGCLSDTITGPQVVARSIFPPGQVFYQCITGTTNLQIRWSPPAVDTQLNFKGYYIQLFNSTPYVPLASNGIDSTIGPAIDSVHVPKIDTMYTFLNKVVQGNRYTVEIWGERFPSAAKPDSLVLSFGHSDLSFYYDANPVFAPPAIFASSNGEAGINLFWQKSVSEPNIGMDGYIIRYIDPDNSAAHLIYFSRPLKNDTGAFSANILQTLVTVPVNTGAPVEKEYMFWIKSIRKDSVESADSMGIKWSGAERIPAGPIPVKLDTGIFMGAVGFSYNLVQTVPNDPTQSLPQLQIMQSNNNVVVNALNGAKFRSQIDKDTNLTLDNNYFPAPFPDADFTQTQLVFPNSGNDKGSVIYAHLAGGNRARIWFGKIIDSTGLGNANSYIRSDSTILIQASFQPQESPQLPFF